MESVISPVSISWVEVCEQNWANMNQTTDESTLLDGVP